MKKLIALVVLFSAFIAVNAQDVIILKTGEEVKSKVLEITSSEVKYKKADNMEGPVYTYQKTDVFMIKYSNGTKDIITADKPTGQTEVKKEKPQESTKSFLNAGVVELGGSVLFSSVKVETNGYYSSDATNTFTFSPYVGVMVVKGFEVGIMPGYTSRSYRSSSYSSFNLYLAPSYNFEAGAKTFPFIGLMAGYANATGGSTSIDGLGIGGSAGVKFQVGGNALLQLTLQYLSQNYDHNSYNEETDNIFLTGMGVSFFF